jgi:hypothetical protein
MNSTSAYPRALYGFRFSKSDAAVLLIAALATALLAHHDVPLWWMVLLVVGHFFLFCNVFRVRRSYELIWAALLLVNSACWLLQLHDGWLAITLTQLPVTAAVILLELHSPSYHGILSERLNPRLRDYLTVRMNASTPQRGDTPKPGASDAGAQPQVTTNEISKP